MSAFAMKSTVVASLVVLFASAPTFAGITTATAPATIIYADGFINYPDYAPPFGPLALGSTPGTIVSEAIANTAPVVMTFNYDSTFDGGQMTNHDRLNFLKSNDTGISLTSISFTVAGGTFQGLGFTGDTYTPGRVSITNPTGSPTIPTITYIDNYNNGSNPNITFTPISFIYTFATPLAPGDTFATYLPIFNLNSSGGSFTITESEQTGLIAFSTPEPSTVVSGTIAVALALGVHVWRRRRSS